MTPSPTKEAIELLRLSVEFHSNNGVVNKGHYDHVATLLASHDKLVKGLEAARDALYVAWERTGHADDLAAYHLADLALLKELGQ